jgi:ankyrin repeat protein
MLASLLSISSFLLFSTSYLVAMELPVYIVENGARQNNGPAHDSSLIAAVRSRDIEKVRKALNGAININEMSKYDSMAILHLAAASGWYALVKLLLDRRAGIDGEAYINCEDTHGNTPLDSSLQAIIEHIVKDDPEAQVNKDSLRDLTAIIKLLKTNGGTPKKTHPLTVAALLGNKELVAQNLTSDCNKDLITTALSCAIFLDHIEVARTLVEHIIETEDLSILPKYITMVQAIIDNRSMDDAKREEYKSFYEFLRTTINQSLFAAIRGKNPDRVHLTLEAGAAVDALTPAHETPLHWAAYLGHHHVAQLLLSRGASVYPTTKQGASPLLLASWRSNNDDVIHLLLRKGAPVTLHAQKLAPTLHALFKEHPLLLAAVTGDLSSITRLIPTSSSATMRAALPYAIAQGHVKTVSALLRPLMHELNAPFLKDQSMTACSFFEQKDPRLSEEKRAQYQQIMNVIQQALDELLLICIDERIKLKNNNPAHIRQANARIKNALDSGADSNAKDSAGQAALYLAVNAGNVDSARFLLAAEANPFTAASNTESLLHLAAQGGHCAIAEFLIAAGVPVNDVNADEMSPLHLALLRGHYKMAELLLKRGANVHQTNVPLHKLIHVVARENHLHEAIDLLLDNGAHLNAISEGGTPLQIAAANNCHEAVKRLLMRGAIIKRDPHIQGIIERLYQDSPLITAALNNDNALLLKHLQKDNTHICQALAYAIAHGHVGLVLPFIPGFVESQGIAGLTELLVRTRDLAANTDPTIPQGRRAHYQEIVNILHKKRADLRSLTEDLTSPLTEKDIEHLANSRLQEARRQVSLLLTRGTIPLLISYNAALSAILHAPGNAREIIKTTLNFIRMRNKEQIIQKLRDYEEIEHMLILPKPTPMSAQSATQIITHALELLKTNQHILLPACPYFNRLITVLNQYPTLINNGHVIIMRALELVHERLNHSITPEERSLYEKLRNILRTSIAHQSRFATGTLPDTVMNLILSFLTNYEMPHDNRLQE